MKKTGRLLVLLTVLSLLITMFPAAVAENAVPKTDPQVIDTVPTEISLPSDFTLGDYLFVDDIYLQKASFTAPEKGTYYFYERREDSVKPLIQVYTKEDDNLVEGAVVGESDKELVVAVYLKKGYSYYVNFSFVPETQPNTMKEGIFIACCLPSHHIEPDGNWETILKPEKGKPGKKVKYCDFCHQVGATALIPGIPWNLSFGTIRFDGMKLKWKAVEDATQYEVYARRKKPSTKAKLLGTTTKTYFQVAGLDMGTKYYFQVKAITPYGTSDFSEMISGVPMIKAPLKFKVKSASAGHVTLTWKKRAGADGYMIYRSETLDGTYKKVKTLAGGNKESITMSATKGKGFYYKIAAYKKIGSKKVVAEFTNPKYVMVKK